MSWNYPPGVTGNEYEIAGPDREWSDEREVYCKNEECSEYEKEREEEVDIQSYRHTSWWSWTCPTCNQEAEFERDDG